MARGIYPLLDVVVERSESPFVSAALKDTDRRVGEGKPVAPSFLLACVLWADARDGWAARIKQGQHSHPALMDAIEDVFNARIGDVSGRGRLAGDMREIWLMQPRFDKRTGSAPFGLVDQPRFRASFDFMRLRADVGEVDESLADWWQEFSMATDSARQDLVDIVRQEQQSQPRRVRVVRAPRPVDAPPSGSSPASMAPPDEAMSPATGEDGIPSDPAPRKRRRRRRSGSGPSGGAEGGGGDTGGPAP
jgi:poly(A) polymerase